MTSIEMFAKKKKKRKEKKKRWNGHACHRVARLGTPILGDGGIPVRAFPMTSTVNDTLFISRHTILKVSFQYHITRLNASSLKLSFHLSKCKHM